MPGEIPKHILVGPSVILMPVTEIYLLMRAGSPLPELDIEFGKYQTGAIRCHYPLIVFLPASGGLYRIMAQQLVIAPQSRLDLNM
jgi:uncharacterized membrane protein